MSKRITTSEFQTRLNEIYGDQFELLSEYVNNETKVLLKCNRCGNEILKKPVKMTGSTREGCYICSGKNRYKTKESFQMEVDAKYPNTYIVLEEYENSKTPIAVKRIPCGHTYKVSPDNLLRGKGCPRCGIRQSHYMDIVEQYLCAHNIKFEKEKRFSDCKNIRTLPFDYYISDMNICIEVDGEFHYPEFNNFKGKNSDYKSVSIRDAIKTNYCSTHGIKLIRLPFFQESHFTNILDSELQANTEITC